MSRFARLCVTAILSILVSALAAQAQPITTDSRIKTLVYDPNEVFSITTHYGYQCNIEFGFKETIQTISVGDRVGWQVSPSGQRLFIRAQEENAHTNMTVITNLRAYQFDLRSSAADAVFDSDQLTYVVRFFYPDDRGYAGNQPPGGYLPPPPAPSAAYRVAATSVRPTSVTTPSIAPAFNYHYTYSGTPAAAPLKIFDDGKRTYFKFPPGATPQISVISTTGEIFAIATEPTTDGLLAVNAVAPRFRVDQAGQQVFVYNDASGAI